MPKCAIRPQDIDASPSPLLVNYVEFAGEHLAHEERADLFRGDPMWLRRVGEMAVRKYAPSLSQSLSHEHLTPEPTTFAEMGSK